jgi:hypothetical protein
MRIILCKLWSDVSEFDKNQFEEEYKTDIEPFVSVIPVIVVQHINEYRSEKTITCLFEGIGKFIFLLCPTSQRQLVATGSQSRYN